MTFADTTREYEAWLRGAVGDLVQPDLDHKHRVLADPADPFPFFRGTYYRWASLWPASSDIAGSSVAS